MKTFGDSLLSILAVLWVALFSSSGLASVLPIFTTYTDHVNSFITQMHLQKQFGKNVKILAARGYIGHWDEALAGEVEIIDDQAAIRKLKIFAVPFADVRGYRASIIGGVIQSTDGIRILEFITPVEIPYDKTSAASIPVIAGGDGNLAEKPNDDIELLTRLISAGNRRDIWEYVLGSIREQTDSGISIRTAFERNGFSCPIAPIWFPQKSIWYAAACISNIR